MTKKLLTFVISVLIIACSLSLGASALNAKDGMDIYKSENGRILCVSDRGDCINYPENTAEGIIAAAKQGADIVMCDVSVTSDYAAVLMNNDSLQKMTGSDKASVSSLTLEEISKLRLRNSHGGSIREFTDYTVQTLEDVLKRTKSTVLMLNIDFENADTVYETVQRADRMASVIFFVGHEKADNVAEWIASKNQKPEVITYFKGNVIFSACSYVTKSQEAGASGICLATKNPYGVVFGETVMGKFNAGTRAMAMSSRPELCGKIRRDSAVWWDDLISRGYNMILTNEPANLSEYIKNTSTERAKLQTEYDLINNTFTLPDIKASSYRDYKKAYEKAYANAQAVLANQNASLSDIQTAYAQLKLAHSDIVDNYDALANGTAGVTITVPRIITAVLVIAGVTAGEIFIAKHTKKKGEKPQNKSK